jgi:hypothetical protein
MFKIAEYGVFCNRSLPIVFTVQVPLYSSYGSTIFLEETRVLLCSQINLGFVSDIRSLVFVLKSSDHRLYVYIHGFDMLVYFDTRFTNKL